MKYLIGVVQRKTNQSFVDIYYPGNVRYKGKKVIIPDFHTIAHLEDFVETYGQEEFKEQELIIGLTI